jgi:purine-nucleoside phosphorylase
MPTPHINAEPGDFAEAVLLPGDPLRAKFIADKYLEDAREVTTVRNMLGFTGTFSGMPVSVMGTGMGIPSASIYLTELIREYGVKRLVRVGSALGLSKSVGMREIIIATAAGTDSGTNRARYRGYDFAAAADFFLVRAAVGAADAKGINVHVGTLHSSDLFYRPDPEAFETFVKMGVLGLEMEASGLYAVAAENGARALAIVTVSDHYQTGEETTSEEREKTFGDMMVVALEGLKLDAGR